RSRKATSSRSSITWSSRSWVSAEYPATAWAVDRFTATSLRRELADRADPVSPSALDPTRRSRVSTCPDSTPVYPPRTTQESARVVHTSQNSPASLGSGHREVGRGGTLVRVDEATVRGRSASRARPHPRRGPQHARADPVRHHILVDQERRLRRVRSVQRGRREPQAHVWQTAARALRAS